MLLLPNQQRLVDEVAADPHLATKELGELDRCFFDLADRNKMDGYYYDQWQFVLERYEALVACVANQRQ